MATSTFQPHSTEAEQGTLGAILFDPDCVFDICATLQPSDFYDTAHQEIFRAIESLSEERKPIDLITLSDRLKTSKTVNAAGGSAYLAELATCVPTAANAGEYVAMVRDKALHRAVATAGTKIAQLGNDETLKGMEVLEKAEQQVLAISRQCSESRPQHVTDIGAESYEWYARVHEADDSETLHGIPTGFPDLDHFIMGLEPGQLTILAARPSIGKTSLALNIARNVAADGQKAVTLFSLEMTKRQIMDRLIASYLGVETWKLKKGKLTDQEFGKLGTLMDSLRQMTLHIDDDPDSTLANLRSKARRQQMEHGLDLLVIDYLQLIEVTDRVAGENRTQQVSHISKNLKALARELQCPILALSQLSRSVEQRSPAIPILSDLRESGAIEQDADIVLMMFRESAYNEDCEHPGETDIYVRKNRNGATGRVSLFFDAGRMSFRSLERSGGVAS